MTRRSKAAPALTPQEVDTLRALVASLALDTIDSEDDADEVRLFITKREAHAAARILYEKVVQLNGNEVRSRHSDAALDLARAIAPHAGSKKDAAQRVASQGTIALDIVAAALGLPQPRSTVIEPRYIAERLSRKDEPQRRLPSSRAAIERAAKKAPRK